MAAAGSVPGGARARRVRPYRNVRAWVALLGGVVLVGVGVGMMLDGLLGVSPGDVFFSGMSAATGLTVGTMVVVSYFVMVAATYPFGVRPGVGTLACVLLIGPMVDAARWVDASLGVLGWSVPALAAWWVAGFVLFVFGVVGLFAADLGVSPYDQLTQAVAKVTRRSLGVARFVVDGSFLLVGAVLGGSWGVGTVLLLLLVPVALNRVLPRARRFVAEGRRR